MDKKEIKSDFLNNVSEILQSARKKAKTAINLFYKVYSTDEIGETVFSQFKVSLFFIDEVEHYRKYDVSGNPENGIFADIIKFHFKGSSYPSFLLR